MGSVTTIHCYKCYFFPSKDVEFFVTNCMHIYCAKCRLSCVDEADKNTTKCATCLKTGIKFLKIGNSMPENVKKYFSPVQIEFAKIRKEITNVLAFQQNQHENLIDKLREKEENFDKLKAMYMEEVKKKENYKQALQACQSKFAGKQDSTVSPKKDCEHSKKTAVSTSQIMSRRISSKSDGDSPIKRPASRKDYSVVQKKVPRIDEPASKQVRNSVNDNPYKTPSRPAKLPSGSLNPFVTPSQVFVKKMPVSERMRNSWNSNSSASFIENPTEIVRPASRKSIA